MGQYGLDGLPTSEPKVLLAERLTGLSNKDDELNPEVVEALSVIVGDFKTNFDVETISEYSNGWIDLCKSNDCYVSKLITVLERLDAIKPYDNFYQKHRTQLAGFSENDFVTALRNFYSYTDRLVYKYLFFDHLEEDSDIADIQEQVDEITNSDDELSRKKEQIEDIVEKLVFLWEEKNIVSKAKKIDRNIVLNLPIQDLDFAIFDKEKVNEVPMLGGKALVLSIRQLYFDIEFETKTGKLDEEKIRLLTTSNGAKYANLKGIGHIEQLNIPDYVGISTEVYRKWTTGEPIDQDLHEFFEWASGRPVIIRSSAVFSEDGNELTGAGVYESPCLEEGYDFDKFKETVIKVFESVDSETAIQYRKTHGIDTEAMGIIVQEYITPHGKGYVDTVVRGVPELLRIKQDEKIEIILNKAKLRNLILSRDSVLDHNDIFHYQLDGKRVSSMFIAELIRALAYIIVTLERFYGKQVQIEFVISDSGELFIVQVRPLPNSYSEKANVKFPKEQEPVFSGRALGITDVELDILPSFDETNAEKVGVVIFSESHLASMSRPERFFPKTGAVILLKGARSFGGHLEMICAERGICVIIGEEDTISGASERLRKQKRLHLILNGLRGNVYAT